MNTSRTAALLLTSAFAAALAPAQQRSLARSFVPAQPLVARGQLVDPATGEHRELPGIKGHAAICRPHQPGVIAAGNLLVDLAGRQLLRVAGDEVVLTDLTGDVRWRRDVVAASLPKRAQLGDCWLHATRVLVRSGGRILALERGNGELAWRADGDAAPLVLVGGDLWITAGAVGDHFVLQARSVQNGARAFRAELRSAPRRLHHAPHGVAALQAGCVEVFDAFGPRLFVVDGAFDEVHADAAGWLLRRGLELHAFDRAGELRWRATAERPRFVDHHRLHVTSSNVVLLASDSEMSDSGAHVQRIDPNDGAMLWSRHAEGLNIPHSKYRHDTWLRARSAAVDVVCQGSGGAFVVTLDSDDGEVRQRIDVR